MLLADHHVNHDLYDDIKDNQFHRNHHADDHHLSHYDGYNKCDPDCDGNYHISHANKQYNCDVLDNGVLYNDDQSNFHDKCYDHEPDNINLLHSDYNYDICDPDLSHEL